ncbi:MAG: alpha/beta fold hydrolase [Anaerolineae bacterium]|nr:alpha/beta fold hydrolase [Anaerolineae bacterium]
MIGPMSWASGYTAHSQSDLPSTWQAHYRFKDLAERGLLRLEDVNRVLFNADLQDFAWKVVWAGGAPTPDEAFARRLADVDGYVIFIHGWTGSNAIWEELPAEIVTRNPRLVALAVDHNGFGGSPFLDRTPEYVECSPLGAMRVLEAWLDTLNVRRRLGDPRPRTVNFVGHSMGGAALFFLDDTRWRLGEQTRTAVAPALLVHDDIGRTFYTTLGLGIGLVGRLQFLEAIERLVSPQVLETLTAGATRRVKEEHRRIYAATLRSVTARTLAAMGAIKDHPMARTWELMQVFLGHRDPLVQLPPMLDLLLELGFGTDQVRVVFGTHYFFSLGEEWQRVHRQNRALLVDSILDIHERALRRQRGA